MNTMIPFRGELSALRNNDAKSLEYYQSMRATIHEAMAYDVQLFDWFDEEDEAIEIARQWLALRPGETGPIFWEIWTDGEEGACFWEVYVSQEKAIIARDEAIAEDIAKGYRWPYARVIRALKADDKGRLASRDGCFHPCIRPWEYWAWD